MAQSTATDQDALEPGQLHPQTILPVLQSLHPAFQPAFQPLHFPTQPMLTRIEFYHGTIAHSIYLRRDSRQEQVQEQP